MMTDKNVGFVKETLIPEILKDNGKHFCMAHWHNYGNPNCPICIGGRIENLFKGKVRQENLDKCDYGIVGQLIGLDENQSNRLFYDWWMMNQNSGGMAVMSEKLKAFLQPFNKAYHTAKTRRKQAQVAGKLLREVCRTKGECLND